MSTAYARRQAVPAGLVGAVALAAVGCAGGHRPNKAPPTISPTRSTSSPITTADPGLLASRLTAPPEDAIPALATRRARFEHARASDRPIVPLDGPLDPQQQLAQDVALADPSVAVRARDPDSGLAQRAEVLGLHPVRPGDVTPVTAGCGSIPCHRVEIYNHARASTTVVIVDTQRRAVLAVNDYLEMQPDVPPRLADLARDIAVHAPEVTALLGFAPRSDEAVMAGTKSALNQTRCERSRHLCVAPTFVVGDQALWAVVDLTDGVLVGTRWTDVGKVGVGPVVTEKGLQDEVVAATYCEQETAVARGDWTMRTILTSSDGLRLSDVRFRDAPVLDDVKLVDWHVSYSGTDGFGYSDAIGCPTFSQAAVVAHSGPVIEDWVDVAAAVGFSITQDFRSDDWPMPCNYAYRQRFDFYADGRFRVVAGNLGRGCGVGGVYRPVLRIALAGARNTFSRWDGGAWQPWATEGVALQDADTAYTPEGYLYRIADEAGRGHHIEPGRGQFNDGGRGDNAFTYVTLNKQGVDEGRSDLITIGPCCNTDDRQGPEKFIGAAPDPIAGGPLVLWYVPQMTNDDTPGRAYCWADIALEDGLTAPRAYPCFAGPLFVPIAR